ncbi:hypothetical protein [Haladaptatus caseinilyticus]|uniref:hypothetical protein n=1 Tax=Haladaptatus caseinilyticus TaxID=2993314 RepID=UPI00224AFF71|nr:hypothetical protein [Haladaptatus caseinilyticus]
MRRFPALLLVLLVITSGCADYIPWLERSPKPKADSQANLNPPPGANTEWIFDSERLLSAHESALAGMNYRKEVRIRPNHSTGPTEWSNSTLDAHVGDGRTRLHERGDIRALVGISEPYHGYSANGTAIWRVPQNGDYNYHYVSAPANPIWENVENDTRMSQILMNSDFVWNGTTVRNGTTLYRYRAASHTELSTAKSLWATVFVDERGFVYELSGTLQTTGRPTTVNFSYRFSETNSTPTKPNWASRVTRLTAVHDSGALAIENTGKTVIPAGSSGVAVITNGSISVGERLEFTKPFRPDEVAYVILTDVGNKTTNGITDGKIQVRKHAPSPTEAVRSQFEWRWIRFGDPNGNWSVKIQRRSRND